LGWARAWPAKKFDEGRAACRLCFPSRRAKNFGQMWHGLGLGLQMRCLLVPGCAAAAPQSLSALLLQKLPEGTSSRQGCLRLPSGTSSLDHCTLRALIWLGGDFLKQHPLKGSLRGASVSNAHWQAAVPLPSRAWCITCASAEAQLHQRPPVKLQALSQGAPLHRCRMVACWLAHLF